MRTLILMGTPRKSNLYARLSINILVRSIESCFIYLMAWEHRIVLQNSCFRKTLSNRCFILFSSKKQIYKILFKKTKSS